ncbi:gas vesicle protein GvpJ [Streptomyces tendae]|uniref:gas vesicle protein GvpJ n=1 Tax=Streptomyces tendae TaxID=1932 RepID=UPI003D761D59
MTLDDLVEVLLNKGAVLHLDLIVAVAEIPLIGVSIRAAVAGMETMLEYGMMRHWDEATPAWAERSVGRRALELREDEGIIRTMRGGHLLTGGIYRGWRPGTVHLTDQRLVVLREEPREILWQTELDEVRAARLVPERAVGGAESLRLEVTRADGSRELLSARDPEALLDLLTRTRAGRLTPALPAPPSTDEQPRSPRVTCGSRSPAGRAPVARRPGTADRRPAGLEVTRRLQARPGCAHGRHRRRTAAARVQPGGREQRPGGRHGR